MLNNVDNNSFDNNGYVKKPVQVMQIEDLGKLTKIKKCSKSND